MKKKNVKVHENGIIHPYLRFSKHLVILYFHPFLSQPKLMAIVGKDLFGYATRGQARVVVLLLVNYLETVLVFSCS